MPSIHDLMNSTPMLEDSSSSLQVSSTSPEQNLQVVPQSRALSVRKTNSKRSSSSGSSSRSSQRPPVMSRSVSHRGPGSMAGSEGSAHVCSVTNQQLNMQIGVPPEQVIQHVQHVEAEASQHVRATEMRAQELVHTVHSKAQAVVAEARAKTEGVIHAAHAHVHSLEATLEQMRVRHQQEITQVQAEANMISHESSQRLEQAMQENQRLSQRLEAQKQELRTQHESQNEMRAIIRSLQEQVALLQHSAQPSPARRDHNGAGFDENEVMECIRELRGELRQMKQLQQPRPMASAPHPAVYHVASPVPSACAGIDPGVLSPGHSSKGSLYQSWPTTPKTDDPYKRPVSSSSSSSTDGGGGSPPAGSPHRPGSDFATRSAGVGSAAVVVESDIYKSKDLNLLKIETLPTNAAEFRTWKNTFLTRVASIDLTGRDIILDWVMCAFEEDRNFASFQDSGLLPRLDAHLGSLHMDSRHLRGELGIRFQTHAEACQAQRRAPRGRSFLHMIAQHFRLDLNRGANLTQQALLELQLDSFAVKDLEKFVERIEYVLNCIPESHQPTELTKFTWLYARLKRCKLLQRHIDKIRDSSQTSHVRTWSWLMSKLKAVIIEAREDQNEEAIRNALQTKSEKAKNAKNLVAKPDAHVAEPEAAKLSAAAASTPKAKPKGPPSPKGGGKGKNKADDAEKNDKKGKGKGDFKGDLSKSKAHGGSKGKPKVGSDGRPTVPCLFYPKGTCNRGENCPFSHEDSASSKAKAKPAPAKASAAKAAVATVIASSASQGASAVTSNMSVFASTLRLVFAPFKFLLPLFSTLGSIMPTNRSVVEPGVGVCIPSASPPETCWGNAFGVEPDMVGVCIPSASPSQVPCPCSGLPAVMHKPHESACIASSQSFDVGDTIGIEWIADSGASRSLASEESLIAQGLSPELLQKCTVPAPALSFETGNGITQSYEQLPTHGSCFGTHDHRLLPSCPVVRSLGEVVASGRPFVWLPGELPYFANSVDDIEVKKKGHVVHADRIEDSVPIFKEIVQLAHRAFAMPVAREDSAGGDGTAASSVKDPEVAVEVPVEPLQPDLLEDSVEGPVDELLRESLTIKHRMCHIPKNPYCEVCQRSRMFKKKTSSLRHQPLLDRGDLEPCSAFGERLASDFIVVVKSSDGVKDAYVQVIRDEYSGLIVAYPCMKHDAETVSRNLLAFLGPSYHSTPMITCKTDNAPEFQASCATLGFIHEPTLARRFPHIAVLEREIRTLEEIARAVQLEAGFHIVRDLWRHAVTYAAITMNMHHPVRIEGKACNRFELATGKKFEGRELLLGQLIHVRKDRGSRHKFETAASPALFAGWRFDSGPKSHKGVYYALDYKSVKDGTPGYAFALAIPCEEVFVPEGLPILPLKVAADQALASFSDPKPEDVAVIEVPFSDLPRDVPPVKRHEYITMDRIIKYGATPSCRACSRLQGAHTSACKARFDGLVRADKITSPKLPKSKQSPGTPTASVLAPTTPAPATPKPESRHEPLVDDLTSATAAASERVSGEGVHDRDHVFDLPFSAGIDPEHPETALIAKADQQINQEFVDMSESRTRYRRLHSMSGKDTLFVSMHVLNSLSSVTSRRALVSVLVA